MSDVKLWRYVLKSEQREGWAIFVLGSDGYFSAVSDFGNYAFLWTHHGCKDFREFLLRADRDWDYFVNKLSSGMEYDGEATKKLVIQRLEEMVKDKKISIDECAAQLEMLDVEYSIESSAGEFHAWCFDSGVLITDPHELEERRHPWDVMNFVKKAMVRLIPLLKKDLEAEYGKTEEAVL